MALSNEQLETLCKLKQGELTCAFITAGGDGFSCGKGTFAEPHIRKRIAEGTMAAKGDNCSGPPEFAKAED